MDETGWQAMRAANATYRAPYERNPDGSYRPVVTVNPINGPAIRQHPPGHPGAPSAPFPSVNHGQHGQHGHLHPHAHSPPSQGGYHAPANHPAPWMPDGRQHRERAKTLSAVERSNSYIPMAKMEPHLQVLCGPLLRYDTIENGVWYGAVMIVTADAGSIYEPHPQVTLEHDPQNPLTRMSSDPASYHSSPLSPTLSGFSHASHPSNLYPGGPAFLNAPPPVSPRSPSPSTKRSDVTAEELWVYNGPYGTCTFWRAMIQITLAPHEMGITYRVNGGQGIQFFVPGRNQELRWAAHSCNGFSAGINADDFKGPGHASGFDPVWTDLLEKHTAKPFHALVGGGDQLYCDSLMREPELQEFVALKTGKEKIAYPVSEALRLAVDRFYFSHYCLVFRHGKFAQANSSIPMVNMLDDHDMIDGYGSYPEDLQRSPLFQIIGNRAYHFFLLFQCFVYDEVDGIETEHGKHIMRSMMFGGPGPYIPYLSHSISTYLGPSTWMVMLDCRAERTLQQVCSEATYRRLFDTLWSLPENVKHVVLQLGIPIAYPRMNFLESALELSFNPLVALGKKDKLGLGSMVNKFNKDAELLDDLMDHWTSKTHKKERNWFIEQLQNFAQLRQIRVTFLSGDVHCAAVGVLKTLSVQGSKHGPALNPVNDHRYMLNIVTSAIVNTPPPNGVLSMVSSLSDKVHKTMHYAQTDETMIPLFQTDTDGKPLKSKNIMGRRNYTIVEYDTRTDELCFDIRVEKVKGVGTTVGYPIRAPRPGWQAP